MNDLPEVADAFDKMVTSVILDAFPAPWVEDDITYQLLRKWSKQFGDVELYDFSNVVRVSCRGYKFRGTPENRYGDIGLHVRINFADGNTVSGVGFMEAKVKGRDSAEFPAIDHAQLRRIRSNAPSAQLLLYDYQRITGYRPVDTPLRSVFQPSGSLAQITRFTHAASLPIATYLGIRKPTTALYKHAAPLADQVWYRYLYGLDLHHDPRYVRAVTDFNARQGAPNFIMEISVAHRNRELPDLGNVTNDLYAEIE